MTSNPFRSSPLERIKDAAKTNSRSAAANALFGPTADRFEKYFRDLKEDLKKADMDVLYRTYVSKMFLYSSLTLLSVFIIGTIYTLMTTPPLMEALRFSIGLPLFLSGAVFTLMYVYPTQMARRRKESINENLPFALNHLSAIATSGIPPSSMFELLEGFDDYGAISDEAGEITKRVNVFGEDLTTALEQSADTSPSDEWADVLYGMLSTIETGGNIDEYIKQQSSEALFDFKMERKKEIERLTTYASFYTAIVIAAPVFLIVILSVMNLLGGRIMGFEIRDLMWLGVHILIPGINTLFIIFLLLKVD